MIVSGVTWMVVADGARARIFEERRRSGPLRELSQHAMEIESGDRPASGMKPGTMHQRFGPGRHAGEHADPSQEAEARFLRRLAERLYAAARRRDFEHLVLVAPARALGSLRAALEPAVSRMVEADDAHDRTRDDAESLRGHLRQIRATA